MSRKFTMNSVDELASFIDQVAEILLQENLSLFVGAGSSIQYSLPGWIKLVEEVVGGADDIVDPIIKAEYGKLKNIDVKSRIANKLLGYNIDSSIRTTYLHYLLNHKYKSIWTTNYDNVIERILDNKGVSYKEIATYRDFNHLSNNRLFLYKMNGSCRNPDSIVIDKDDFLEFEYLHEGFRILLKRELLCNNMLFVGCSFNDDILRKCIKDIIRCTSILNDANYNNEHFAIIAESNNQLLEYVVSDLSSKYNISCLAVSNPKKSFIIAEILSSKVRSESVFISGAKSFSSESQELDAKNFCRQLSLMLKERRYKVISGMGMSIGNFVVGPIIKRAHEKNENVDRFISINPFPFSTYKEHYIHRKSMISMSGISIFIYGDYRDDYERTGMWSEYLISKEQKNIIIAIPTSYPSISNTIFANELTDDKSFCSRHECLLKSFTKNTDIRDSLESLICQLYAYSTKKYEELINQAYYNYNH